MPANHCTPRIIERKTKALKKDLPNHKISSLNEKDLAKLKMGSYLSVAKGSDEPPRMMTIEYKGGAKNKQPLVLVGKGITFDTGGISLKPGAAMDEMKWDMCGAATVFGGCRIVICGISYINKCILQRKLYCVTRPQTVQALRQWERLERVQVMLAFAGVCSCHDVLLLGNGGTNVAFVGKH